MIPLEILARRVVGHPGEDLHRVAALLEATSEIVDSERLRPEVLRDDEDSHVGARERRVGNHVSVVPSLPAQIEGLRRTVACVEENPA